MQKMVEAINPVVSAADSVGRISILLHDHVLETAFLASWLISVALTHKLYLTSDHHAGPLPTTSWPEDSLSVVRIYSTVVNWAPAMCQAMFQVLEIE